MSEAAYRETTAQTWETPTCHLMWLAQEAYAGSGGGGADCGPGCGPGLECPNGCAMQGFTGNWAQIPGPSQCQGCPPCVYVDCWGCVQCNQ